MTRNNFEQALLNDPNKTFVVPEDKYPIKILGFTAGYCEDYTPVDDMPAVVQYENVVMNHQLQGVQNGQIPKTCRALCIDYFEGTEKMYNDENEVIYENKMNKFMQG